MVFGREGRGCLWWGGDGVAEIPTSLLVGVEVSGRN